jgi:two-component system cell cycle response regulator
VAVAALGYAVAWLGPASLAPAGALIAILVLTAALGRLGGVLGAVIALPLPLPPAVVAGLAVGALVNGELHERRRRSSRELTARSFTDRLTGLRNYDFFAEAMRAEVARVRRYGGCVTLVLVDLDRFKAFNDRHGHAAGNRLLAAAGRAIEREKRDADVAARFGGEEFAVLVPGRTTDGMVVAERLREAIASLPGPTRRHDLTAAVTASAGVATFPVDARDGRELFELADAALYEAKRRGRDQVTTAAELAPQPLSLAR